MTNPIQSCFAGRIAPWVILVHTGRVSGRSYRTPLMAWKRGGLLMIVIMYGEQSNWLRNVLAAEPAAGAGSAGAAAGAEIIRAGRRYRLRNAHVEKAPARPDLSPIGRLLTRVFGSALVTELVPVGGA